MCAQALKAVVSKKAPRASMSTTVAAATADATPSVTTSSGGAGTRVMIIGNAFHPSQRGAS